MLVRKSDRRGPYVVRTDNQGPEQRDGLLGKPAQDLSNNLSHRPATIRQDPLPSGNRLPDASFYGSRPPRAIAGSWLRAPDRGRLRLTR